MLNVSVNMKFVSLLMLNEVSNRLFGWNEWCIWMLNFHKENLCYLSLS